MWLTILFKIACLKKTGGYTQGPTCRLWAVENYLRRGSALLDVTAALLILTLLSPALISLFNASRVFAVYASNQVEALYCVQGVLEELKASSESSWGVAQGGGDHFIRLEAGEGVDSQGLLVALTSGVGEGQVRKITDFDPETKTAFIEPTWVDPPVHGKTNYVLLRDRTLRDHLHIYTCNQINDTQLITVTFLDDRHSVPLEISLTTGRCGWQL